MDYEKIIGLRTDKTIYKDGDRVIKVFNHHYKKSQVLNEALNLAKIEETDLNVPNLRAVYQENNHWVIELSFIKGKTLLRLMQEQPSKFNEYLRQFIELQIKVHHTKAPILSKMKDKLGYKIEDSMLSATMRMFVRQSLDQKKSDLSLCHGDFFPGNIIIDESNQPFIIDWAHVSLGPKLADVANTFLDLWVEFDRSVAEMYLNMFIDLTNESKDEILSWLPIVSAARSNRGIKSERDFLLKLVQQSMEESNGY